MSVALDIKTLRSLAEDSGLLHRPTSLAELGPGNLLYLTIQTALILERDLARMDRKVARIRAVITEVVEVVDSELRDYDI